MKPQPMQHRERPYYLRAFLAYLLLTLLMVAPLLPHIGTTILGGPVAQRDAWQNVWNLWWVGQAVASFQNPFHSPLLYYPEGVDLHLQTLNISNGLLVLPVTALFGPTAGYNTAMVLAFALAGLGGYAFALYVSGNRAAAFVGGLLLTFSPFHITKLWDGQLEMIALQWLPFYALFLLRALQHNQRSDALFAGVFLALIGYTSWYYFLFFAIYSALFATLWLAFPQPDTKLRSGIEHSSGEKGFWYKAITATTGRWFMLSQLVLVAVCGVILLLPVLLPAIDDVGGLGGGREGADTLDFLKLIHSADLLDFWLPNALHPLWGPAVTRLGEQLHPFVAAWNIALGYCALGLALFGAVAAWRVAWRWWLLTLIALILALGPLLQIGGQRTGILLPYALLTYLPGVGIANRPNHFVVIAVVLLAPLAALGLRALLERISPARRPLALALVGGLIVFELLPPAWPLFRSNPHPYYAQLAGAQGALIDLPPRLESSEPLESQLVHGLPMMGGYVSRTPYYRFGKEMPVVRDLWAMQPGEQRLIPSGPDDALVVLNTFDLRHIVIHWQTLTQEQRSALETVIAQMLPDVAPSYSDQQLTVYQVPMAELRPFAYFSNGWYGEEQEGQRRWRWMGREGEITLINPTNAPASITLQLTAQSYAEARDVELLFDMQPAGRWRVERGDTTITLQLLLQPGEQHLLLRAPTTEENSRSQRQLSIVIVDSELN